LRVGDPLATVSCVQHAIRFADDVPEDLLVEAAGEASLDGLDVMVTDILAQPRYVPGLALVLDYTRLELAALRPEDLVRRVHVALKHADVIGPKRIAVVSHDVRMEHTRAVGRDEPPWLLFGTVDDARAWLAAPDAK
jgi:hypothetical protein